MGRYVSKAFTIVELLIIIAVIAVLALITMVAYNGVQNRAEYSVARADMRSFGESVKLFRLENRRYPTTASDFSYVLVEADLYDSTRTGEKSYAICANDDGYAFVAWTPIVTAYKNGDVLYLVAEDGGQTEHVLTNSSLSSEPTRVDKVCDQVYPVATFEDWTYNLP